MATEDKIEAFWLWFRANSRKLRNIRSADDPEYLELECHLTAIGEVNFEIGGSGTNDDLELILTTHGDVDKFPLVDSVVAAAPAIDGWRIRSLKPPLAENIEIVFGGERMRSKDIWIKIDAGVSAQNQLCVYLGVAKSIDPALDQARKRGALVLLESYLGERAFSSQLDVLGFIDIPVDPRREGFVPIEEVANRLGVHRVQ